MRLAGHLTEGKQRKYIQFWFRTLKGKYHTEKVGTMADNIKMYVKMLRNRMGGRALDNRRRADDTEMNLRVPLKE